MADWLSLFTLISCFFTILVLAKFFGKSGLFAYSVITVIGSNIQVLKLTKYSVLNDPIALGTVLFSTTFAVDNILTEYYGQKTAKKCVWLSFLCYLFFALIMKITILHPTVKYDGCQNLHEEIKAIFSPSFTFFISSIISYIISQLTDIYIFSMLKKLTDGTHKSIRSFISMVVSTFVDNCVFSILAWVIFSDNPINLSSLWTIYIFNTCLIRLVIAVFCVPLVRLSGVVMLKE